MTYGFATISILFYNSGTFLKQISQSSQLTTFGLTTGMSECDLDVLLMQLSQTLLSKITADVLRN